MQMTADLKLDGANGIATFESGGHTYAAVTALVDNGVQILDITNSFGLGDIIPATDNIRDQADTVLSIANGIATFESGTATHTPPLHHHLKTASRYWISPTHTISPLQTVSQMTAT